MGAVIRMQDTLRREYGHQDWRLSLRAGPDCIGILGQCLLITSRSDLLGLKVSGPGLQYQTLFANVSDVALFGMNTFRLTGEKMDLIAALSDELARPSGIVETMLKFCDPDQDPALDRHLQRILDRGRDAVNKCAIAIQEINDQFLKWSELTENLFKALEDTSSNKASEAATVKEDLKKIDVQKGLEEGEKARHESRLQELRAQKQKVLLKKEWYDNHAAKLATGAGFTEGGIVATVATTTAVVVAGIGIVIGGAAACLHYSSLRDDLSKLEEDQAQRDISIRDMAAQAAELQEALLKLSSDESSIAQVMKIVQEAVRHMSQLQSRITSFMEFLVQIASIIDRTVATSKFVHETVEDTKGLAMPEIKQDLLVNAFDMRTRFMFALRASEIYKAVSAQYIIPTINELPKLRLLDEGTDSEINDRLAQLNTLRSEISLGTEELVKKMHAALKQDLKQIAENSAICFQLSDESADENGTLS